MKNLIKLVTAGLLLSGIASAHISDFTIFKTLAPHQTKASPLEIGSGNATIEVNPLSSNKLLTCSISNDEGNTFAQAKVDHCVLNFKVKDAGNFVLKVTNDSDESVDIRAFLHEAK